MQKTHRKKDILHVSYRCLSKVNLCQDSIMMHAMWQGWERNNCKLRSVHLQRLRWLCQGVCFGKASEWASMRQAIHSKILLKSIHPLSVTKGEMFHPTSFYFTIIPTVFSNIKNFSSGTVRSRKGWGANFEFDPL